MSSYEKTHERIRLFLEEIDTDESETEPGDKEIQADDNDPEYIIERDEKTDDININRLSFSGLSLSLIAVCILDLDTVTLWKNRLLPL